MGYLDSQGVSGALNHHSDTKNEYEYTFVYDTEGRRQTPQVNQFCTGMTERVEITLETPQIRSSKGKTAQSIQENLPYVSGRSLASDAGNQRLSRSPTPTQRGNNPQATQLGKLSMEELVTEDHRRSIKEESLNRTRSEQLKSQAIVSSSEKSGLYYYVKNSQLDGRVVLGHINPLDRRAHV